MMTDYNELSAIFESSNARSLSSNQLTSEFVWTDSFGCLFSEQNQMILGSRGSGKTALIKMLAHENLCKLASRYELAKDVIENKKFIATYVPLKVEWVNSLSNFENDKDEYFIWSLNLSLCARLLDTIKSCIEEYYSNEVEKLRVERLISKSISEFWFESKVFNNFHSVRNELESIEYRKNLIFNKESMGLPITDEEKLIGAAFHTSLFKPFEIATKSTHDILNLPTRCKWYICIDEAEFLSHNHHKILNTHMRSATDLVFKITTMPYRHHTLDTEVEANINIGHDIDYVYIDKLGTSQLNQKVADRKIKDFAKELFQNRLHFFNKNDLTFEGLFGKSLLTEDTTSLSDQERVLAMVESYCNTTTISRANYLYKKDLKSFDDSIARPLRGILLLRDEFNKKSGNTQSNLYSGTSIISRCSDGNPRRLIRLLNHLLRNSSDKEKSIARENQSERMKTYSFRELEVIKFGKGGRKAFSFINTIGNFFKKKCLEDELAARTPQSFTIDQNTSDEAWENIKTAVDLGLIYPYVRKDRNTQSLFPAKEGRFVLANCLAPTFNLFPRVGHAIKLESILEGKTPTALSGDVQMGLFDDEI